MIERKTRQKFVVATGIALVTYHFGRKNVLEALQLIYAIFGHADCWGMLGSDDVIFSSPARYCESLYRGHQLSRYIFATTQTTATLNSKAKKRGGGQIAAAAC